MSLPKERKLLIAYPHGFCAGVARAVNMVEKALLSGERIYCLNEIVHNRQVVEKLQAAGVVFLSSVLDAPEGARLVFSAHGVSPAVRTQASLRRLQIIDATCPFVEKVHREVRRYASMGYRILLIGDHNHDEIKGVVGEAPGKITVINRMEDVNRLDMDTSSKWAVITQTTINPDDYADIMTALESLCPDITKQPSGDICYATRNRQAAVKAIAKCSDIVLVLGSANSANSKRLAEVARRQGTETYMIGRMEDLDLARLARAQTIGLTAGASTPEHFVEECMRRLSGAGFRTCEKITVANESMPGFNQAPDFNG